MKTTIWFVLASAFLGCSAPVPDVPDGGFRRPLDPATVGSFPCDSGEDAWEVFYRRPTTQFESDRCRGRYSIDVRERYCCKPGRDRCTLRLREEKCQ